jgi:hypothetical protein
MKVLGLDHKEYRLALSGRRVGNKDARVRSAGHLEARRLLSKLFPFDPPCEEVALPGCGVALFLDFILPQRRLAVEVQGRQHRQAVPHFQGGPKGFAAQVRRDKLKQEWAALNGVRLVVLHDDRRDDWERQLAAAFDRLADSPDGTA